jgi:hypothetical protein
LQNPLLTFLRRGAKIVLRNDALLDRPDHERHVAREVCQVVFAPVAFLEFLEMYKGVVPGVEEKILLPALPVVRPVLGRAARPRKQSASTRYLGFPVGFQLI